MMIEHWQNLLLIIGVFSVGVASPGPATLMIAAVAVSQGRQPAIALSLGIISGSTVWAAVAACGFVATIQTSVTLFVMMKIIGALYLLYLAIRSFRSAWSPQPLADPQQGARDQSLGRSYFKGLLLHLTNPKAPLVWVATLSIGMEASVEPAFLAVVVGLCSLIAITIFTSYALMFSTAVASDTYRKLRRPFDLMVGVLFGAAAIRMLTLRSA